MNEYKKEIKISVRNLVEFVLRTGDIDSSFTGSSRAVEGTRLHKKIQKTQGKEYSPEVFLKTTVEFDDFYGCFIIDEIKTTRILQSPALGTGQMLRIYPCVK